MNSAVPVVASSGRIPMTYYRLYFMHAVTGRIQEFREFDAGCDFSAVAQAERWRDGTAMELWSRARKIKRWEARQEGGQDLAAGENPSAQLRRSNCL
jgi:hypothetical protein